MRTGSCVLPQTVVGASLDVLTVWEANISTDRDQAGGCRNFKLPVENRPKYHPFSHQNFIFSLPLLRAFICGHFYPVFNVKSWQEHAKYLGQVNRDVTICHGAEVGHSHSLSTVMK